MLKLPSLNWLNLESVILRSQSQHNRPETLLVRWPFVLHKEKTEGNWRQFQLTYYSVVWGSSSKYPSHNVLKFFLISSEHSFYKSSLPVHVILVWCAIFNLPCCNNVQVMKRRHVWVLCGIQGISTSALRYCWDQFYNRHPDNQIDSILLNLLPSYELLNTSFKLQSVSPGSSLLTKSEKKMTAESVRAQLVLLLQKEHCSPVLPPHAYPLAAKHHTLVNGVDLLTFLKSGFR